MMRSRGLHHRSSPRVPPKQSILDVELPETVQDAVELPKQRRRRKVGGGASRLLLRRQRRQNNNNNNKSGIVWLAIGGCAAAIGFILYSSFMGIHWASQTLQRHHDNVAATGGAKLKTNTAWKLAPLLSPVVPPQSITFQQQQQLIDEDAVILDHHHHHHRPRRRTTGMMKLPYPLEEEELIEARHLDFGDINVRIVEALNDEQLLPRVVYKDLRAARGFSRDEEDGKSKSRIWYEYVFAFDDDNLRTPYMVFDDDHIVEDYKCRRVSWHRENRMNCNNVHEIDILSYIGEGESKYLG